MPVTVEVTGLRELEKALDNIDKHTARRTPARNALKKAGQQIADKASALAPDDPETHVEDLHREIKVGTRLTKRQSKLQRAMLRAKGVDLKRLVQVFVGVTEKVNNYAHLKEFGTIIHAPHPFMRPAWQSSKGNVLRQIKSFLASEITKAARRQFKRKSRGK